MSPLRFSIRSLFNYSLFFSVGALVFLDFAAAAINCIKAGSLEFCQFPMPLYSQNNLALGEYLLPNGAGGSQLCAPTSGAMVLQALINQKSSATQVVGWTRDKIQNKSQINQIINQAFVMGTSPQGGTSLDGIRNGVDRRSNDFSKNGSMGKSVWGGLRLYTTDNFISLMRDGYVPTMVYGRYSGSTTDTLGVKTTTYNRGGGHVVALAASITVPTQKILVIHDPWFAVRYGDQINTLIPINIRVRVAVVAKTILPGGFSSLGYLSSKLTGQEVPFVDGYSAATAP